MKPNLPPAEQRTHLGLKLQSQTQVRKATTRALAPKPYTPEPLVSDPKLFEPQVQIIDPSTL